MHWNRVAGWAKQHGVKVAFGTDILFQPEGTYKQTEHLTRFAEVSGNAETLRRCRSSAHIDAGWPRSAPQSAGDQVLA